MAAITPHHRRTSSRRWLLVGALALAGGASLPAGADAVPASETIRCTSGRTGFDFCKRSKFFVKKCRHVSVRLIDSGDNRWVKVQVRKPGEGSSRWESRKLKPTESDSGDVAVGPNGKKDRFRPSLWVDTQGFTATAVTLRLRYSGC